MHHGDLGVLQDLLAARDLRVVQGEADGAGEEDLALGIGDRRRHGAADHVGEGDDAVGLPLREMIGELVAGDARERVLRLEQAEAPGQGEQDRIARRMADDLVDLLELVEIDHDHGRAQAVVLAREGERGLEPVVEELAVRQAREVVVHRVVQQALLGGLASVTSASVPTMRMTSPSEPITGRALRRNQWCGPAAERRRKSCDRRPRRCSMTVEGGPVAVAVEGWIRSSQAEAGPSREPRLRPS